MKLKASSTSIDHAPFHGSEPHRICNGSADLPKILTSSSVELSSRKASARKKIESIDDTHIRMTRERSISILNAPSDNRIYPTEHGWLDLAPLLHVPESRYSAVKKPKRNKYNLGEVALMDEVHFQKTLELFPEKIRGIPGFIDAFLRGEPGGRTEGFNLHRNQFAATKFDSELGGFLISPNPGHTPEKGKTYIDNANHILEITRRNGGFALVAFWVPPKIYEKYEGFQQLFLGTPIPADCPEIKKQRLHVENRQNTNPDDELIKDYRSRTGLPFLAIPVDLQRQHVPLLKELQSLAYDHLASVYGVDAKKNKIEIYTHGPVYALDTAGLHFHVRVNQARHPTEKDLRYISIDDVITRLEQGTSLINAPRTASGKYITIDPIIKPEDYKVNGIEYDLAPNVWAKPKHLPEASYADGKYINRMKDLRQGMQVTKKAEKKYDRPNIALIHPAELEKRLESYNLLPALPNFIHGFFVGSEKSKIDAYEKHPEQFVGTHFDEKLGGILIMPNPSYVPGKDEIFQDPKAIRAESRHRGGFGLVSYLIPPNKYEDYSIFRSIFETKNSSPKGPTSEPIAHLDGKRETISEYKIRTGLHYVATASDLTADYKPLLEEFRVLAISHLKSVYEVTLAKDKIEVYVHSPLYGDKTVGLHFHIRVNQVLHACEKDTQKLCLNKIIDILNRANASPKDIKNSILNHTPHTRSSKVFSMSPIWGPRQFKDKNISFDVIENPWYRPYWSRTSS